MLRKCFVTLVVFVLLLSEPSAVLADGTDLGYSWASHAEPYSFPFGNLIDSHQQTRLLKNGRLQGYIYIQFTGEEIDGIPVARRADCTNPALDCRVGWEVIGVPVSGARLVQKGPRLWDFDPAALPDDAEFTHFHWTMDNLGRNPKKPCGLVLNAVDPSVTYSGYLFKRTAVTTFYWLGGNDDRESGRLVTPGLDLHSNLLGRWTGGGGHGGGEPGGEPGGETGGCEGHDGGDTGGHDGGDTGGHDGGDTGGHDGGEPGEDPGGCSDTGGCAGH